MRRGSGTTRYWRTSPPMGMTWATPGTVSSCGRTVKSASSRSVIGSTLVLDMAISMISPITDEIGPICAATSGGSCSRTNCSRSATCWRAR